MPDEFVPQNTNTSHCSDQQTFGRLSTRYDYVAKGITGDDDYPNGACQPWLHYNMRVGNIQVNQNVTAGGIIQAPQFQGVINVQSWKGFDIKHPNKPNHRLRHICLEGPEGGIYFRGRLTDENIIQLPSYWDGLIDPESITVTLTQIGYSQDLIIEKIEWGKQVKVKSGNGTTIDCYYVVHAARIDGEPLIVEYEGETPAEYPGSDQQYSISGYDYDARGNKSTKEEISNG
jgi:hypothetical protein